MRQGERKRKPTEKMIELSTKRKEVESIKGPSRRNPTSVPMGTITQQNSSKKLFNEYLLAANHTWADLEEISMRTKAAENTGAKMPIQTIYSILEGFVRFLYNYDATKSRNKENKYPFKTADSYFSQAKQLLIDTFGELTENKCTKIRSQMKKLFTERDVRLSITAHQAPPATVHDIKILSSLLYTRGDIQSIQFQAVLVLQWHMLGRSIDCCWIMKRQVKVMPDGEIFISFSRLKTSTLQGVSLFQAKYDWELCPYLAIAVALVTSDYPSPFLFNHLNLHEMEAEVSPEFGVVSQLEACALGIDDEKSYSVDIDLDTKKGRKRPSAAQFTNSKLTELEKMYYEEASHKSNADMNQFGHVTLTRKLQSHSLRRGAAQHVNSSPKIPVQWLCSRGNWMMDSLSKAFAYIGTTMDDDRKVGKTLSSWDPDDEVPPLELQVLSLSMSDVETKRLYKVERNLFQYCREMRDENGNLNNCNIEDSLMHLCFSCILLHVRMLTKNDKSILTQRIYQACTIAETDIQLLYKAGDLLATETNCPTDKAVYHATKMNLETRLDAVNNKVDRLLHDFTYLKRQNAQIMQLLKGITSNDIIESASPSALAPNIKLSTLINFSAPINRFFYSWFIVEPWKYPRVGKAEQSLMSELCAAIAILKIVYNDPLYIGEKPTQDDVEEFSSWKSQLSAISNTIMDRFNANMATVDRKKPTLKASGIRGRYRTCHQASPEFARIIRRFTKLWSEEQVVDFVTPKEFQKEGAFHLKALPIITLIPVGEEEEI